MTQCGSNGDNSNHSQTLQLGSMNDPNMNKSAFIFHSHWLTEIDYSHLTKSFKCTFTVKAALGELIYATIQSMTFESNPNGGCKDYIKVNIIFLLSLFQVNIIV